jgi:O-antigen/teichoic acid export membrane protein
VIAASEVAGKVATLALTIVAARILGPFDFGTFAYALSFSLLVATIPTWGLDALLVQRASANVARLPVFLSETVIWRTALVVPVFVMAGLVGVALRPTTRAGVTLLLVLAASMVDLYLEVGRDIAAVKQEQVRASLMLVLQRYSAAVLATLALVAGYGLIGLSAAFLIGSLVGAAGMFFTVRRMGVSFDFGRVHRAGLLQTGRLSVPLGILTVVSMVLFRVDQVILDALKGEQAVGTYAAAYKLLETTTFVAWAVSRAVFPVMSAAKEPWRVRQALEQGVAAVSLFFVPFGVGLWFEAGPVLRLLYGARYVAEGTSVARWLAPSPLFFSIAFLGLFALVARERRWQVVVASVVATVSNIGLNLVLIPHLAGMGAAIATTVSYAVESVLVLALCVRAIGWVAIHKALALPAAAAVPMAAAIALVRANLPVEVLVGVGVYSATWYLLARWRAPDQVAVLASVLRWRRLHDVEPEGPEDPSP